MSLSSFLFLFLFFSGQDSFPHFHGKVRERACREPLLPFSGAISSCREERATPEIPRSQHSSLPRALASRVEGRLPLLSPLVPVLGGSVRALRSLRQRRHAYAPRKGPQGPREKDCQKPDEMGMARLVLKDGVTRTETRCRYCFRFSR